MARRIVMCQKTSVTKMLSREYSLLAQRLTSRAKTTTFFAFANTVETLNYKRNQSRSWLDRDPLPKSIRTLNQMSVSSTSYYTTMIPFGNSNYSGMVGVNLIHACFNATEPEEIINALSDNIHPSRLEVDMFRIVGPDYHHVDNRLMALLLVKNGLTHATMFDRTGHVLQPSERPIQKKTSSC